MKPLVKDCLPWVFLLSVSVAVILLIGSWLNGGNLGTNYIAGIAGGVIGILFGILSGSCFSEHSINCTSKKCHRWCEVNGEE